MTSPSGSFFVFLFAFNLKIAEERAPEYIPALKHMEAILLSEYVHTTS